MGSNFADFVRFRLHNYACTQQCINLFKVGQIYIYVKKASSVTIKL